MAGADTSPPEALPGSAFRRPGSRARAALLLLCGFGAAGGCLDFSPRAVERKGSLSDGGDGGAISPSTCTVCITTPWPDEECARSFDACVADPGCNRLHKCVLAKGCHEYPVVEQADIDEIIKCVVACLRDQDIASAEHPAVTLYTPINVCVPKLCVGPCYTGHRLASADGG